MLRIRCSEEEWEALKQRSEEAGISMSALVRDHLGRISIKNRDDERQKIAMLNRINLNLSAIAEWASTHHKDANAIEVIAHLISLQRDISRIAL